MDIEEKRARHRQYQKRYKDAHKHPCPVCGKLIYPASKYCRQHQQQPRGNKSSAWKTGRISTHGYVFLYAPDHPRARDRHVFEHIIVWEKAHNKSLPDGWVIHHLNGIRNDNRINNLIALPNRKHIHLIGALHKRIQQLEALLNNQHQLL
jgi:HNH endonuclease